LPVCIENNPHLDNRYFFSVIFAFLWKHFIQQWRQWEPPLPKNLGPKGARGYTEGAAPAAAIAG